MKYGLFENQLKTVEEILASHPEIEEAVLFGSRAIDTFKEASDVDIALKGKKVNHKLALKLQSYFEEETDLPYFFDVASYSHIDNKKLIQHIDKEGIVIYRKGWRTVKLGEICSDISYGYTARAKNKPIGPKFLRITDIVPNKIDWLNVPYCKINTNDISKYKLKIGDIVIARTGANTGFNKIIKNDMKSVFASYLIRYRINRETSSSFYISYILQSSHWKEFVRSIIGGSAQPGANAKQFASFELLLPPLPEQEAIAEVLSSLDDKIELLHQQNKTLEDMAQTLFHKWFIEDANYSWEKGKLGDISTLKSGYAFKSKDFVDSSIFKVIKIKNLKGKGILDTNDTNYLNSEITQLKKVKEYKLKNGDILLAMSGNTTGKIGVVHDENTNLYLNQRVGKFFIKNPLYRNFLYLLLISGNYEEKIFKMGYGSAQPNINPTQVQNIGINIPSEQKVNSFDQSVQPLFKKIFHNQSQILQIEKLRNTLLPKLITGQTRINF